MRSRASVATIGLVALTAILVAAGLSLAQPGRLHLSQLHWAMAVSSLENVTEIDERQAARAFDSPNTLIQNSPPLTREPAPAGWQSTSTERWASFARFAADVRGDQVPGYVKAVHYDNEAWAETPVGEQRHPGSYERRFCGLAHSHGWSCLTGPGQDLCGVLAHPAHERYAQCYLHLALAAKAARYADIVDIQAQALEARGARAYASFVGRAAAQARAANPEVMVLANLAPSPGAATISPSTMFACAHAVLPHVDGFYTTVNEGDGETMVSFLQLLDGLSLERS